jgi:uncharacterized protein (TIGR00251 family)
MTWYRRDGAALILNLHIQPGAKHTTPAGLHGNALKLRLAAPPLEGRANDALIKFLAEQFDVPQRNIELLRGAQSRHKLVRINGSAVAPERLAAA